MGDATIGLLNRGPQPTKQVRGAGPSVRHREVSLGVVADVDGVIDILMIPLVHSRQQPNLSRKFKSEFKRASNVYIRVESDTVATANEPRLGLFWFIAKDHDFSRFASCSRPFSQISEVAGFKTLDDGHVDIWPTLQRLDPTLLDFDYGHFPRGRVKLAQRRRSMAPRSRSKA